MPTGRRSLTKTCGNGALPVFLTSSVKMTLVLGEPAVGLAVLVTDIFGFLGLDIGGGVRGDILAVRGFACNAHVIGQSPGTGNGSVDMGDDLQRPVAAWRHWADVGPGDIPAVCSCPQGKTRHKSCQPAEDR